jgi:hypothetical protein
VKITNRYGNTANVSFSQWQDYGYDVESTIIKDSTKPVVLVNPSLTSIEFNNLEGCRKFDNTPLDLLSMIVEPYQSIVLFGCDYYISGTYKNSDNNYDGNLDKNKKLSFSLHSAAYDTNPNAAPNSLDALKYSIDKGIIFDGDVSLSTDNILVMSHDSPGNSAGYTTLDEILDYIKNDAPQAFISIEAKYFDWNPSDVRDRDIIAILNRIKYYDVFENVMIWSRSVEGAVLIREYLDSIGVTNAHIGIWVYNQYTYDGDSHQRVHDLIMQVAENKYKYVDLVGLYASHGFPDGIRDLNQEIQIQMLFSDNPPPVSTINEYKEKGLTHIASDYPEEYLETELFK